MYNNTIRKKYQSEKNLIIMKTGTILKHIKGNFTVVFKSMVNAVEFRTQDDFQFRLDEFVAI